MQIERKAVAQIDARRRDAGQALAQREPRLDFADPTGCPDGRKRESHRPTRAPSRRRAFPRRTAPQTMTSQ